jgi:hypothetical protein
MQNMRGFNHHPSYSIKHTILINVRTKKGKFLQSVNVCTSSSMWYAYIRSHFFLS